MSKEERLQKRRERWRKNRNAEKEDQLMIDYVRHKYAAIYEEAVRVCKQLAKKYPGKNDLRKTQEHKIWLSNDSTTIHPIFNSISPSTSALPESQTLTIIARPLLPTTIANPQTTTILPNPEPSSPEPQIPEPPIPELSIPEPPTPELSIPEQLNPEPQIPEPPIPELSIPEPPTPELSIPEQLNPEPQIPEPPIPELSIPEPPTPELSIPEQLNPEPPSPKTPIPPKSKGKISYTDNMQLIIPLLKSPVKQSGVITETLEIITEEIIQGDEHQVVEQLDPQTMEQLVSELRADPALKDIFADIEQQLELEGLDIDIDMDTRLEDELENWEFF